jgi:hypothetical protein
MIWSLMGTVEAILRRACGWTALFLASWAAAVIIASHVKKQISVFT